MKSLFKGKKSYTRKPSESTKNKISMGVKRANSLKPVKIKKR